MAAAMIELGEFDNVKSKSGEAEAEKEPPSTPSYGLLLARFTTPTSSSSTNAHRVPTLTGLLLVHFLSRCFRPRVGRTC